MRKISVLFFAVLLCLTGCKPKETILSGQVFIVTKGAENYKLGDVEILLVEKPQVTDFLQKKQSFIDSELASRQLEMTNALKAVDTALENCKKIQADFDLYKTQKPYKTNADFVKLDSQWNTLFRQYLTVSNYLSQLTAAADAALALSQKQQSFEGLEKVNDLQLKQVETLKQREKIAETVNSVNDKMAEIKNKAIETEAKKLNAAKSKLITAQTRAKIAGISLAAYPAAGDCFEDFSPIITQKTRTDSDGKFTISYSRDKIFTIFVRAQRAVLNATETYYWLIDASTNSKPAQVLLSNNNLAFIDPDGYFKVKPKEMSQDN